MTKSATNVFLILLALVAVAWGQVAGLQQGYACVCTGEVLTTLADHCHSPEAGLTIPCHEQEQESQSQSGESSQLPVDDTRTQPHVPLTTDLKAQNKISSSLEIPVPAALSFSDLPDFALPVMERPAATQPPDLAPPVDPGESPPTALQVTACTVFLV